MHLNASKLLKNQILKVLFVMPKFNPIFTFSKINLKLTKKSSRFIFSNYFIKKLLEFYIVSSLISLINYIHIICVVNYSILYFLTIR